jgi:hypothetical protein
MLQQANPVLRLPVREEAAPLPPAGTLAAYVTVDDARAGHARGLAARPGARIPWPPERSDACWCGSGLKYKKCCLPRSRS